jgi:hypothetical protein
MAYCVRSLGQRSVTRTLSEGFLALAAICFAASLYLFGSSNNAPITLPLPGPGLAAASPFRLATAGHFRLEAAVPISATSSHSLTLSAAPPVSCDLRLVFTGPAGVRTEQRVTMLERGAQYGAGGIDYYYSTETPELVRGNYWLQITNNGNEQPFREAGSVLSLVRIAPPTEAFLLASLVRGTGWLSLVVGGLGVGVSLFRKGRTNAIGT